MSSLDIKTFIASIHPFDGLEREELGRFADKIDILYLKEGEYAAREGDEGEFFYIVAKGVVKEEGESEFFYGPRDFFDFESLLDGKFKSSFLAAEESLLYAVKKEDFLLAVHSNTKIENYFFLSAAKKLEAKHRASNSYLVQRISDIRFEAPIFVDESATIFDTVKLMSETSKTFALINFKDGQKGIITDSDLRKKVLLKRLDVDSPVGTVATKSIKSIEKSDFLFNAMLVMTRHNIKRVVLTDGGEICGVLQDIDILSALSSHTQFTARKIEMAKTKEELKAAICDIDSSVKTLLAGGVKVKHIIKLVSELNMQIYKKVYEWSFESAIRDRCALVIFGSEGRGEQILRTDQDNGVIAEEGIDASLLAGCAKTFNDTLVWLGYPPCEGGVMASNSEWGKSVEAYKKDIYEMVMTPAEKSFLVLPIIMDMRFVCGKEELYLEVKEYLAKKLSQNPQIIARMAGGSLSFETPLSMLGGFVLDKKEHSGELDIKKGGIFPIVNGVRALAFEKGIDVNNTFERVKELNNLALIDRVFAEELIEAYNFLLEIRLKERLYKIQTGQKPDNYISPSRLSKLERDLLKDVFKIVDKFKKFLFAHFKLGYIS